MPASPISTTCLALLGALVLTSNVNAAARAYHVIDSIAGPGGRWDYVRVDTAGDRVLVAHGTSVTAVGLAGRTVTSGLVPGLFLHDAMPINGHEMLVTDGGKGEVIFADMVSGDTIATVKAGKNPDAAAFDPHTGLIAVMNHSGGDITIVDAKARAAVETIAVGGALEAAAVDGAGRAFVNVEDKNQVAVIDLAARKVEARYALEGCDGPTGIAYDAADKMLIIACDGDTAFVDARTGKTLQTLPTGKGADGVAFDVQRRLAFVPAGGAGTLAVVSIARGKSRIMQTLRTEVGARTIALDPRTGRVYLPSGTFEPAVTAGARPALKPGSFHLLVVGP